MNDPSEAARVRGVEGLRDLVDDRHGAARVEAPGLGEQPTEVSSLYEPHGDEERAVGFPDGVNGDHVRMLDLRRYRRLALEARAELRIVGKFSDDHL